MEVREEIGGLPQVFEDGSWFETHGHCEELLDFFVQARKQYIEDLNTVPGLLVGLVEVVRELCIPFNTIVKF